MKLEERRRLSAARELVEIAIMKTCLDALDIAMRLEHPTIDEPMEAGDPPTLTRARRVIRRADALRRALTKYRAALDDVLDPIWPDEHLPF